MKTGNSSQNRFALTQNKEYIKDPLAYNLISWILYQHKFKGTSQFALYSIKLGENRSTGTIKKVNSFVSYSKITESKNCLIKEVDHRIICSSLTTLPFLFYWHFPLLCKLKFRKMILELIKNVVFYLMQQWSPHTNQQRVTAAVLSDKNVQLNFIQTRNRKWLLFQPRGERL